MSDDISDLVDAIASAVRPRPRLTVSEWADANIMLVTGAEQGPWRTSRVPYLREPMDALSDHEACEEVVIIKPSQIGASEAANCVLGYYMAHAPSPILMVRPDIEEAKRYSKQRIARMIEASDALRAVVVEPKSRDSGNTILDKEFEGGSLSLVGSNSPSGLASQPVRIVVGDEVDRWAEEAGSEGDQGDLARQRTNTYARRKLLWLSTPGETSTSKIEPMYLASDRRRYWVPCPFCKTEQVLEFKQLKWPDGKPREAYYECVSCARAIAERHKREMLAAGRWIAEDPTSEVRGYKLNGLYSPWLKWHEVATRWVKAKGHPQRLKVFVNTILGETWDTHRETRVDPTKLSLLRADVRLDQGGWPIIPPGVSLLTASADLQGDRIEVGLYGWGRGEEMWILDRRQIWVDPSAPQAWTELDELLLAAWETHDGGFMRLSASGLDTQGHHTAMAHEFIKSRQGRRVWGLKGVGGPGRKPWPKKPSKSVKSGVTFYAVGVDACKAQLYARIKASIELVEKKQPLTGAGAVHIAAHLADDLEYLRQIVSEVPETVRVHGHPRIRWTLPNGVRNEGLDLAVYAYAVLQGLKARGRRLDVDPIAQNVRSASAHMRTQNSPGSGPTSAATPQPALPAPSARPTTAPSPSPRQPPKKRPRYF